MIIVVLKGRILFTSNEHAVIASPEAPIYIPGGTAYKNEYLENSEAILFNFEEIEQNNTMRRLSPIEQQTAIRISERVSILKARNSPAACAESLSLLYDLMRSGYRESVTKERRLINPAIQYIELHFGDPDLTVSRLAELCFVSTVYLNQLFKKEFSQTPFSYITRRRMEIARDMLRENCTVVESAQFVGYSDIYQFSRAFKKHYGVSPKNMKDRQ